ncbi:MAG: YHS domain-containing (seleno)protein [Planctomycetota bacterium]
MAKPINAENGVAIGGFDPVSYFKGEAQEGQASLTADHGGATYRFASRENLDAFKADPEKYAPQYGGYCATAMSEGKIFEVDPKNYKITGDKLYLFYKGEAGDTLPDWNADEANRRANADKHWADDSYGPAE